MTFNFDGNECYNQVDTYFNVGVLEKIVIKSKSGDSKILESGAGTLRGKIVDHKDFKNLCLKAIVGTFNRSPYDFKQVGYVYEA